MNMCSNIRSLMFDRCRRFNPTNLVVNSRRLKCDKEKEGKILTEATMNQNMVKLQYAVRGPLLMRAGEIEKELKKGEKKPFDTVIRANLGDAQAMGQPFITFSRQVIACVSFPELIEKYDFPEDVKKRAKEILDNCVGHSVGAYTMSQGIEMIRRDIALFIENRDCHPCRWQDVVLTTGASTGIKTVLQLFIHEVDCKKPGIMVPIPQYPLYSATLAEYGMDKVDYYLDEDNNWGLDVAELEKSLSCAKSKVRAIVVINPGNPTGQVLTCENIQAIIKFAYENKLVILADEVYQSNIWDECSKFFAFKKVLMDMGEPYSTKQELISFMSASKGYTGECGIRGGWMEIVNIDPTVQAHLYKLFSAMLCPNTIGQTCMDTIARPPKCGDPSFKKWCREKTNILDSLKERAQMTEETFNKMKGFKCNVLQGAMYAFPRIDLPPKAIEEAKKQKRAPDLYYAFKLLEETGICVVAGSGFGQRPGTHHFRTTILPQTDLLKKMLEIFQKFHEKFVKEHS